MLRHAALSDALQCEQAEQLRTRPGIVGGLPIARQRAMARRAASWLLPGTSTELALRNGALRLAALPGVDRLVRTMLEPLV